MGDLISRSALIESTELASKIYSFNLVPYIKVDDLLDFVDNMPTAYDIDKVVEQLEGLQEIDGDWFTNEQISKAIDIVKAGGVNE